MGDVEAIASKMASARATWEKISSLRQKQSHIERSNPDSTYYSEKLSGWTVHIGKRNGNAKHHHIRCDQGSGCLPCQGCTVLYLCRGEKGQKASSARLRTWTCWYLRQVSPSPFSGFTGFIGSLSRISISHSIKDSRAPSIDSGTRQVPDGGTSPWIRFSSYCLSLRVGKVGM